MSNAPKHITSPSNPAVKFLKSLSLKKYRDESGLFLVEGTRHAQEAIAGGMVLRTLVFSSRAKSEAADLAPSAQEVLETTDDILSKITGRDNTQPVICAFEQRLAKIDDVQQGLWVGLEDIRDPGNLGTIMRTCDAVGAKGVILIGQTCDAFAPETVRATMGSFARIHVARASQDEFLKWRAGYKSQIIGTHLRTDVDYKTPDYNASMILLMGSEQNGLSDALAKACTALVKIPMTGGAESLNLGVATGVMLYAVTRL